MGREKEKVGLYLDPQEEDALHLILATEDGIRSEEMLALIKKLPND